MIRNEKRSCRMISTYHDDQWSSSHPLTTLQQNDFRFTSLDRRWEQKSADWTELKKLMERISIEVRVEIVDRRERERNYSWWELEMKRFLRREEEAKWRNNSRKKKKRWVMLKNLSHRMLMMTMGWRVAQVWKKRRNAGTPHLFFWCCCLG